MSEAWYFSRHGRSSRGIIQLASETSWLSWFVPEALEFCRAERLLGVSGQPARTEGEDAQRFLSLYDTALPYVYGYLLARCGRAVLAEELTSETMLAAVDALKRDAGPASLSMSWLLGIARHKLVDYWRHLGREERTFQTIAKQQTEAEDPWDVHLDSLRARQTLEKLTPQHRSVLTLRYLDDLPVADVADILDRTLHATEALLVRAKQAFRRAYSEQEDPSCA